jgi:3-methylcrotonyl-CoA carboxylase alpha subunit
VAAAALLSGLLATPAGPIADPWDRFDGWRIAGPAPFTTEWEIAGQVIPAAVDDGAVRVGTGEPEPVEARLVQGGLIVDRGGIARRFSYAHDDPEVWLGRAGDAWRLRRRRDRIDRAGPAETGSGRLSSPMPGTVLSVHVRAGEAVGAGQPVITVEAMKMEYVVAAPQAGTVSELLVKAGDAVRLDQPLAVIAPAEDGR